MTDKKSPVTNSAKPVARENALEKYKLNPMRIVETLYQAADIKIGKEDGLTLSDKLQIIKNG